MSIYREALLERPGRLARIAAWSVLEAAPAFVLGHALARAIDGGFAASRPGYGLGWLAVLAGVWIVAAVAARQVVLAVADVVEPFRDRLLRQVVDGALRRAGGGAEHSAHAAIARSTLQVEVARDAFAATITVVRSFGFTLAGVALGMATLDLRVAALVLPPFTVGLLLFLASLPVLARRQRAFLLADERTVTAVSATAGGLRDLAACGAQDRAAAATGRQIAEQAATGYALARVTALRTLALSIGGWLPVLLLLAGTPWLLRGGADAGVVIGGLAFVTGSLIPAFGGLVEGLGVSAVRLIVSVDRILTASAPVAAPHDSHALPAADKRVAVDLAGVRFAYGPHAAPVIADLDLTVPHGDHLAVVGPSGIGKSTLAALIGGMLVPQAGTVRVGGVPADRLEHSARVVIPQEAYVFRGSLRENLGYLAQVPESTLDLAVEAVGAADLVRRLGGYGAHVDPGALSAGERQLIALARAYVAPAGLVVLDEATCHLDPAAEARAEDAFARRGGTLIVVAHRISSAVRAGRVLLMDGTSVFLGTHEELVRTASGYRDLVGDWRPEQEYAS